MKCPASLAHNGSGVVEQTALSGIYEFV